MVRDICNVSTHSRPKAAGKLLRYQGALQEVSTHSRPKAADAPDCAPLWACDVSTHSRPKAADTVKTLAPGMMKFQHTAARRRLQMSRYTQTGFSCFNTQPPEGGCRLRVVCNAQFEVSTHSRPKAADKLVISSVANCSFQHTAARRRLQVFKKAYNTTYRFNTQPPEGGCSSIFRP